MNLVIPEPEHLNSILRKKLFSRPIAPLTGSIVVSATIEFNGKFCTRTIEIEYVRIQRVLSSKFVTSKISVSQVSPKNAFRSRRILTEITGSAHEREIVFASVLGQKPNCLRFTLIDPSPRSSPQNRGEAD
jgi:hypothetical protein